MTLLDKVTLANLLIDVTFMLSKFHEYETRNNHTQNQEHGGTNTSSVTTSTSQAVHLMKAFIDKSKHQSLNSAQKQLILQHTPDIQEYRNAYIYNPTETTTEYEAYNYHTTNYTAFCLALQRNPQLAVGWSFSDKAPGIYCADTIEGSEWYKHGDVHNIAVTMCLNTEHCKTIRQRKSAKRSNRVCKNPLKHHIVAAMIYYCEEHPKCH